jgi:hypothetical protein
MRELATSARRTATVTISGGGVTRTISVTQAANRQDVVVEPVPPAGNTPGHLILCPGIPAYDPFGGSFLIVFPPGINGGNWAKKSIVRLL